MSCLLNPHRLGGVAGISGYATPQVLKTPPNVTYAQTFALGNVTGVELGDLVIVHLHVMSNSVAMNPGNFAATLGGVAMTGGTGTAATSTGVFPGSRRFVLQAGASGNLALNVDCGVSARTALAIVWVLKGFSIASPIQASFVPSTGTSALQTLGLPPAGLTTATSGNLYLASISVKGGDVANLVLSGLAISVVDSTGTDPSKHITVGYGHAVPIPAATLTPVANWTSTAQRATGLGTEVNVA